MRIIRCIFAIVVLATFCSAKDLSGKVINRTGSAIAGATVKLLPGGKTTLTGIDGRFTFPSTAAKDLHQNSRINAQSVITPTIVGGALRLNCIQPTKVVITTYTTRGQLVGVVTRNADAGSNSIQLPYHSAGAYVYRVKTDGNVFILRGTANEGIVSGTSSGIRSASLSSTTHMETGSATADQFTVLVTKEGYIDYSVNVSSIYQQELTIRANASEGTVTDIDGNVYQSVRIGNQVWTVENFRATRFNDGEPIPIVTDTAKWGNFNIYSRPEPNNGDPVPQCCFYNNTTNPDTIKKFGALYNWFAVKSGKLAPEGWRVPDSADWMEMRNYLLQNPFNEPATTEANLVVKSLAACTDWVISNGMGALGNDLTANNLTGFGAIPAGYRTGSSMILYMFAGEHAYWWTATEEHPDCPCWFTLYDFTGVIDYLAIMDAGFGLSIRLIKNDY